MSFPFRVLKSRNIYFKAVYAEHTALKLKETFLTPEEIERFDSFKLEKRKRQWLAARYAAKSAVAEAENDRTFFMKPLEYDWTGRPVLDGRLVSLSHSGPWAVAAYKKGSLFTGVDIEQIRDRFGGWYERYFLPEELPQGPEPESATSVWTRKEAALKALGLGLTVSLLSVNASSGGIRFTGKSLDRWTEMGRPGFTADTFNFAGGFIVTVVASEA